MSTSAVFTPPGIDHRIRDFIASSSSPPPHSEADAEFNSLARELFAYQYSANEVLRSLCQVRGVHPEAVSSWREIPALPASAFKEMTVSCLPEAQRRFCFHSSGTTGQQPSRQFHNRDSLELYEHSLLGWFRPHFPSPPASEDGQFTVLSLVPEIRTAPHSSLAHMCETVRRTLGSAESQVLGDVDSDGLWRLSVPRTLAALDLVSSGKRPVLLLGTAFLFVHLLEELRHARREFVLPQGSCAMETGGYKGRSRELTKTELRQNLREGLGLGEAWVVSEYGMSELSSQAYDGRAGGHRGKLRFPPWARVRMISPETGRETADGEPGLISVCDLANVYSAMAIQAEDLGRRTADGFELLGRAPRSEPRGCALMSG